MQLCPAVESWSYKPAEISMGHENYANGIAKCPYFFCVPEISALFFQVQLAISTILLAKNSKLLETPKKTFFWAAVGPRSA